LLRRIAQLIKSFAFARALLGLDMSGGERGGFAVVPIPAIGVGMGYLYVVHARLSYSFRTYWIITRRIEFRAQPACPQVQGSQTAYATILTIYPNLGHKWISVAT
jgi:hypothetical protein